MQSRSHKAAPENAVVRPLPKEPKVDYPIHPKTHVFTAMLRLIGRWSTRQNRRRNRLYTQKTQKTEGGVAEGSLS